MNDHYDSMTDEEIIGLIHELTGNYDQDAENAAEISGKVLTAAKVAADRGNAEAQYLYGLLVLRSNMPDAMKKTAGEYIRRSAEQEHAPALNELGMFFQNGACGFEKNDAKAVECFKKAAEKGFAESLMHLYAAYHSGTGVEKDRETALHYLRTAADADYLPACVILGMEFLSQAGESPEKRAEAAALFLKAAEGNDRVGQYVYGTCCETGIGTEKDLSEAAGWYRRAAKAGDPQANEALKRLGFPGVM